MTFASDRDDFAQIALLLAVDRDHFKKGMFEKNIGILRILLTINLNDFAFKIYSAFLKFSNPQLHYKEDANALSRSRSKTLISTNANH